MQKFNVYFNKTIIFNNNYWSKLYIHFFRRLVRYGVPYAQKNSIVNWYYSTRFFKFMADFRKEYIMISYTYTSAVFYIHKGDFWCWVFCFYINEKCTSYHEKNIFRNVFHNSSRVSTKLGFEFRIQYGRYIVISKYLHEISYNADFVVNIKYKLKMADS